MTWVKIISVEYIYIYNSELILPLSYGSSYEDLQSCAITVTTKLTYIPLPIGLISSYNYVFILRWIPALKICDFWREICLFKYLDHSKGNTYLYFHLFNTLLCRDVAGSQKILYIWAKKLEEDKQKKKKIISLQLEESDFYFPHKTNEVNIAMTTYMETVSN